MITLAINTASVPESVTLFGGKRKIDEISWIGNRDETEKLLQTITELLKKNHLSLNTLKRLNVCRGPGPFSATRIGVTVANLLSFALEIPLYSMETISTMKTLRREKRAVGCAPEYLKAPHITNPKKSPYARTN